MEASIAGATEEWDEKRGARCDVMVWEDFFEEIFEMVDLWTNNLSAVRGDLDGPPAAARSGHRTAEADAAARAQGARV